MDQSIKKLINFMNTTLEEIATENAEAVAHCYDCKTKKEEEEKLFQILREYFEKEQGFIPNFTKPYGRENARTIIVLVDRWKNKLHSITVPFLCDEEERTPASFPKKAAFIGSQLLSKHRRWDTRVLRTLLFRAGEL